MVKMFHARRAFDASQRKQMAESSAVVAEILLQHLTVKHLGMFFLDELFYSHLRYR